MVHVQILCLTLYLPLPRSEEGRRHREDCRTASLKLTIIASPLSIYDDLFFMHLVDEEKIYLRAFEQKSNFIPVLSYASRGKLGPII